MLMILIFFPAVSHDSANEIRYLIISYKIPFREAQVVNSAYYSLGFVFRLFFVMLLFSKYNVRL